MADTGRPETSEEQYQKWLDELAPFLKLGETLNTAIESAGLNQHRSNLYNKYRLNDWFLHKVDAFRAIPGKLANNILVKVLMTVDEKMKQGLSVSEDEMKNVRFFAEKSRVAQAYFVNRQENAPGKSVEEVLNELDGESDTIDDVAENLKGESDVTGQTQIEMVATQPPIQNQEQSGQDGNVPSQPNATKVPV